jgi:PAS domain S-box-containing protein
MEWILLGSASAAAIIAGVAWHRPARIGPWLLLAASITTLAIGDVFYALDRRDTAYLFYLAMFALVALSLLQLTRGGAVLVDRARLIDMLAGACSGLLVIWVFVVGGGDRFGAISPADVIGDLLLVGVAGRLIKAAGRNWSAILLATGAVGMLVSDVLYPLYPGRLGEIGYIVLYVSWGLAALHPSMRQLTQPMPSRPRPWDGRSAALLGLSVATPPAVLLIEAVSGTVGDGVVIAVAAGITLLLTITRLADSVAQHSQALSRERGLREASAALVAAADVPAVDAAVRAAIAQLMPAQAVDDVVFATDDRQVTLDALPPADSGPHPRSWWVDKPRDEGQPASVTLVCPLWLEPLAVARPSGGALVLTGRRDFLNVTRDALEVLAGQATLALDRISLVEAVGRRDSDLYLRAVIHNTADIMLVIDEDQRIRYSSPALRALIGSDELPPLSTLHDLVHPDDRTEIREAFQSEGDGVVYCALQRPDDTQILVEATYRDLRADRLVQGFVVTLRDVTQGRAPEERIPHLDHVDELPAWVNRRSAQHKFRY